MSILAVPMPTLSAKRARRCVPLPTLRNSMSHPILEAISCRCCTIGNCGEDWIRDNACNNGTGRSISGKFLRNIGEFAFRNFANAKRPAAMSGLGRRDGKPLCRENCCNPKINIWRIATQFFLPLNVRRASRSMSGSGRLGCGARIRT